MATREPSGDMFQPTYGQGLVDNKTLGELTDANARVQRYNKLFLNANEQTWKWRDNHIENLRFLSNRQWNDADLADLAEQGRPAITINRSTSIIMTVSGLQRRARQEIRLLPAEPADIVPARLMETLTKFTRDQCKAKTVDSKVFLNKIISGLGFWKLSYDYRRRPQGDIRLECLSPLNVFWDPNYPDCEWSECEYVMHAEWYTLDDAIKQWPKHSTVIRQKYGEWLTSVGAEAGEHAGDSHAVRRSFWDPQTQRARILEVWYHEVQDSEVAVFRDGDIETNPDQIKKIKKALRGMDRIARKAVTFVTQPVKFCKVAHVLDNVELDNEDSDLPFEELPIIPSLGYYFWENPIGMMDIMKDPQKEKNKRRTVITEIAGRQARSGWKNKRGTGANPDDLEDYANGAQVVIEYEQDEPKEIEPPPLDQTLVFLEQNADREIREVVNVNDELLGMTNAETQSGRAIEARQRGGLITQEPLTDSFQDEQQEVAKLMIAMIKDIMTKEEAERVLGTLAQRNPESAEASLIAENTADLDYLLSRAFNTRYDVIVTNKPYDPSFQVSRFNALVDLAEKGLVPPPQVLVRAAMAAGVLEESDGKEWMAALQAQSQTGMPPGAPSGGSGTELPTTPEGVQASEAQQF